MALHAKPGPLDPPVGAQGERMREQIGMFVRREGALQDSRRELETELRTFRKMHELDQRLDSRFSLQSILQQISTFATRDLGYERAVLLLDDRNTGVFTVRASEGYHSDEWRKRITEVVLDADSVLVNFIRQHASVTELVGESTTPELRAFGEKLGVDRFLLCPIFGITKNLIGALIAGNTNDARQFFVEVGAGNRAGRSLSVLAEKTGWAINSCLLNWDLAVERNLLEAKVAERTNELTKAYAQIQEDLANARDFQQSILSAPPRVPGLDVELIYRPCEMVGGDLYDIALHDGRVQVFLADATGHGVGASLTTMFIKSEYDVAIRAPGGPADVLRAINETIAGPSGRLELRFTAICLELDLDRKSLRYATAGHPAPLLLRTNALKELETGGTFMGMLPGMEFPEWRLDFEPGDGLFLFTDGAFEEWDGAGQIFGEERMRQAIVSAAGSGRRAGAAVVSALERFVPELTDDLTFIGLRSIGR